MIVQITETLSQSRFTTYLHAAGFDQARALKLYMWNAKIGASFHIPIQAVEVALRNRVNVALVNQFGPDWWSDHRFTALLDRERHTDLTTVFSRIAKQGLTCETNQVVASLSFGFWVGLLHKKYNPSLWSAQFKRAFPRMPVTRTRQDIFAIAGRIARFRNRIAHHEPLLREDISTLYGEMMQVLSGICPETAAWVRPESDVPRLIRQKP